MRRVPVFNSVRVLDEFAFVCDNLRNGVAELRTANFDEYLRPGCEYSANFPISNFDAEFQVRIRKHARGVIHFYGVTHSSGEYRMITTCTVFPEGWYPDASDAILTMQAETCARLYTARPLSASEFEQPVLPEAAQPKPTV